MSENDKHIDGEDERSNDDSESGTAGTSGDRLIEEYEAKLNGVLSDVNADSDDPHAKQRMSLNLPQPGLARRGFMKAGMAVGAASALAGCSALNFGDQDGGDQQPSTDHSVPPGELDDYYGFWSGGQSGEVRIVGIPSMRELMRIPVFEPDASRGFNHDEKTKQILNEGGGYTWGDNHHPLLSETDGEYDGRWLFINDKANGRIARIDLKYFETDAVVDIPNVQAVHGDAVQSPDTKYVYGVGEFRTPTPNDGRNLRDADEYWSVFTALDPETMDVAWQIRVSGNMDNADSDKDGNWAFATGYNSEEAFEIEGMSHDDRDWVKAFDVAAIESAVEAGETREVGGVPMLDGRVDSPLNQGDEPLVHYIPVPKSPHGIDVEPNGEYAIANGKLSPTCSLIQIDRIKEVDDPADAIVGEPQVGLGPLHTTFDDRGHGYTTLFIDSQVSKWDIQEAVEAEKGSEAPVKGKIDVHYNPGHIQAVEAETVAPEGNWLVSLNKLSKDRFLPLGPIHPDNDQLIDISEDADDEQGGMELVADEPVYPEPHDCVIASADSIQPEVVWNKEDYDTEFVTEDNSRVERDDGSIHIYSASKRSEYGVRDFTVQEGDEVTLTITNIESVRDIVHGVAINEYDINLAIAPQDTREVTFTADKPGVYWIYCTYFCSALHLEMRSRMIVEPAGEG